MTSAGQSADESLDARAAQTVFGQHPGAMASAYESCRHHSIPAKKCLVHFPALLFVVEMGGMREYGEIEGKWLEMKSNLG